MPTVATLLGTYCISLYLQINTLKNNFVKICQNSTLRAAEEQNGTLGNQHSLLKPGVLECPTTWDDDGSYYCSTVALPYALQREQVTEPLLLYYLAIAPSRNVQKSRAKPAWERLPGPSGQSDVLADLQHNMAIMQQTPDQVEASMANLHALLEERLPPRRERVEEERANPEPEAEIPHLEVAIPNLEMATRIAKMAKLEEVVSKSEKIGAGGLDMDRLCLFPNARLPERFKMPDFTKFEGTGMFQNRSNIPEQFQILLSFKLPNPFLESLPKLQIFFRNPTKTKHTHAPMADHGNGGGEGEVVGQAEDRGGPMETQTGDQMATEAVTNAGAVMESGSDGGEGREQEADRLENPRATEENPRTTVLIGAVGSNLAAEGSGMVADGSPVVSGSSGDGGRSGAVGDVPGPNWSLSRDPAIGKSAIIAEEKKPAEKEQTIEAAPVEICEEDIAFRPPVTAATSSRHVPITKEDIAEHLPDDMLARLLEERPDIGEMVLKAKEERAQAIAAWEAAEKAKRDRKDKKEPLQEMEAEERAAEEAHGPRVTAVAEAEAMRWPDYATETYTPPTPHLLIPSGFSAYTPQRSEYEDEMVLRDPQTHIANTWAEEGAAQRDIRGFGGARRSLALYESLPQRVRDLVDAAGFGEFIRTLTRSRIDHAVLVALAERWKDTTNTFHLPPGEMTVTPIDFAVITGLRVGGEPIPFDSSIQNDQVVLEWFLGDAPKIEEGMAKYEQFTKYLKKKVTTEREAEQMARAYLLYLFGTTLYPNRRNRVHLSYLPALRDLRTTSCFDWGGAALGMAYAFLGNSSTTGKSTAGYWRVWELWAYEVLRMYPPQCKHHDLSTLPRALIWSKKNMGLKEGRGDLNAYRLYLDELKSLTGAEPEYLARSRAITANRVLVESAFGWQWYLGDRVTRQSLGYTAFQVRGSLPPRASHTSTYTRAELERFTQPDTELRRFLRPEMDYAKYQRDRLARPLGIQAFRDVQSQARGVAEERRAAGERARGGEGRVRHHTGVPVRGGPPEMSWTVPVVDTQGNPAEIHLAPARVEPPPVTVPVPTEWVNETIRRMLAFENLVRRAAGGFPLELRYPAPSLPQAQRAAAKKPQAQGRATSRSKRTRSPPQKKLAARTPALAVTSQRQTRSSQPVAASQEPARQAMASAEEQFRIAVRKRPVPEEQRAQKKPKLVLLPTSEDEEEDDEDEEEGEEEEEHSSARSDSDDSVDDPAYKEDPKERADDSDDDEWHAQQCNEHPSPRSLRTPILPKMESPLAAILDPWLIRPETIDWESPRSQCLSSVCDLRFMEARPELLEAALVYWDPVMHIFRFYNDEMCPSVEEFQAYLRGFAECGILAIPPFKENMSHLLEAKLNIPDEMSAIIIQNGNLNIVRLIELYGPEGALGDYVRQAHRRFVFSICALAAYMLISANEGVSPNIMSMALQMDARKNIMPIVLAETLIGLDLVKSGQASWFSGCPFLLQSEDIVWRCPWLNLPAMTVNSVGFKRVILARLMSFTFYIPGRTLRQLGRNQENRCFGRERFGLPTFDSHNLQAYKYSWNNRELEEPLPDPITWLESRYVKWLHKEVKARLGGFF
ncbi:hypothetical protein RHMOL_Rhmol06G0117800 [Rhododendron molle]|uniref:Uncharacterized protein n=1 Tax=Rhododendron molle TaxID=49168 RepID=A0ACC0NBI3_RHOML|nr:hypothetical protein RHMOL_Rhmol06G0117800 [Rhododendron molle]